MQSVVAKNDIITGKSRPALLVSTDPKKKKWNSLFSSKDKLNSPTEKSTRHFSFNSIKRSTTDSSISTLPTSPVSFDTVSTFSSKDSDRSSEFSSNHRKKFHVPHFHIRSFSQYGSPVSKDVKTEFNPVVPEPIMPQFVHWSSLDLPLSPPPWELKDNIMSATSPTDNSTTKRSSMGYHMSFDSYDAEEESLASTISTGYLSDSEINTTGKKPKRSSTRSSASDKSVRMLRRHSSFPNYDALSLASSNATLVDNDIISITEQHTRTTRFKRYTHPADKKPALRSCQKAKARAAEAAANGTTVQYGNSIVSTFCEESLKYLYVPNVFDPITREPILEFSSVKPRKYQLHRKTSWKREAKALMTWHHTLDEYLQQPTKIHRSIVSINTRKDILFPFNSLLCIV